MAQYFSDTWSNVLSLLKPSFMRPGERYSWSDFRADLFAGITVAIILVPQSMAFALIAGLPAVYGLYASIPGCLASIWGSSRQLSTGPVAIISFLTLTSLVPLATPGSPEYIQLAATLALLVGLIYALMGFFRFGFVLHLVPHSVILGFSSAAAVIIIVTQLPTLFGIPLTQTGLVLQDVVNLFKNVQSISIISAIIGIGTMIFLSASRRFRTAFPGALVIVAIAVGASILFDLGDRGVALVREVPQSLPAFKLPWIDPSSIALLLPKAAIIALVGYVSAHASAKVAARRTKEHLDTNQELVGQGLANLATAFFQGFPLSGSFTRTAINIEAGARTAGAAVATAVVTMITLLFFTPLFYNLPRPVLAAIVIVAAIPLIDIRKLREMYSISATDGIVAFLTFFLAFLVSADDALFIGILAALVLFIRQTVWGAQVSEMGIDRDLQILRGAIEEKQVDTFSSVVVARIGMSIYYANAAHVTGEIDRVIAENVIRERAAAKYLVLDMSGVNFIDITGLEVLDEYMETLRKRDIKVSMIYVQRRPLESLQHLPWFKDVRILRNIADMRATIPLAHK